MTLNDCNMFKLFSTLWIIDPSFIKPFNRTFNHRSKLTPKETSREKPFIPKNYLVFSERLLENEQVKFPRQKNATVWTVSLFV